MQSETPIQEARLTETQIGAVGEALVSMELLLQSRGRLSPFHPMADDSGIDILVYDKLSGRALPIQVKTRTRTLARHPNVVHFEVRLATAQEQRDAFLLAVLLDRAGRAVQRAWLIPIRELRAIARVHSNKLVIRPSWSSTTNDKYCKYQCADFDEVVARIESYLSNAFD